MNHNPGEHCEDCVQWCRAASDENEDWCTELGTRMLASKEPCDQFEPNTMARIARGVHSIAWLLEALTKGEPAREKEDGACPECGGKNMTLESWNTDGLGPDRYTMSCDNCGREGKGKTEREATDHFRTDP